MSHLAFWTVSYKAIWKHTSLIIKCKIINDQIQHKLTFRYCFAFLVLLLMRMLHCVVPPLCPPGKFLLASRNYNLGCIQVTLVRIKSTMDSFIFLSISFFLLLPDKDRTLLQPVEPHEMIKYVIDFALSSGVENVEFWAYKVVFTSEKLKILDAQVD